MGAEKKNVVAMIPARMGSERLKLKNLIMIDGKPLISYAIKAAKDAGVFDRIVVNSDGQIFKEIANAAGVDFYLREENVANSQTRADDVVHDFIEHNPADVVAWINPTSPLQTGQEVAQAVQYFFDNDLDTLITTKREHVHCNYRSQPVNYDLKEPFAKTQDLEPLDRFVYSVMMWNADSFLKEYSARQRAFFVGKVGFFPVSKMSAMIVKNQEDVELCKYIIEGRNQANKLEYYKAKG